MKEFSKTKFVTKAFHKDFFQSIRDMFGMEQIAYSDLVNETSEEMLEEIGRKGDIAWFRQTVDRTFDKSLQITIYGQYK